MTKTERECRAEIARLAPSARDVSHTERECIRSWECADGYRFLHEMQAHFDRAMLDEAMRSRGKPAVRRRWFR